MTGGAAAPATTSGPDPLVGRVINDRYKITTLIARGGMGKVYAGEQAPLGRSVALKILHPNYKGEHDPDFHRRFFLEAATCAKLTHPNTVTIFDYGRTDDDVYYIAMELLEGRTLHRALREDGPMAPQRALHIARQVCRSLREAHAIHVVHRDLKPANVFLCRRDDDSDFVKVLDFGLVKNTEDTAEDLTQTGLFMGSPKYMAPEQIQGERADGRVDIYALGVILYEMLTGKVPFDRPNSVNILMAHVHDEPPSFEMINPEVHVPPALEAVVRRALAKKPTERFATMDQLLAALKDAGEGIAPGLSTKSLSTSDVLGNSSENAAARGIASGDYQVPSLTPSGVVAVADVSQAVVPVAAASVAPPARPAGPPPWIYALGIVGAVAVAVAAIVAFSGGGDPPSSANPIAGTSQGTGTQGTGTQGTGTQGTGTEGTGTEGTGTQGTGTQGTGTQGTGTQGTGTQGAGTEGAGTEGAGTDGAGAQGGAEPATRLHVIITSSPAGAMVRLGDRRLGQTPIDMELTGDDARSGTEHAFVFALTGYQSTTLRRIVDGDTLSVDARLTRRPTGGMAGGDQTHVQGYRDDPYADP